jgi:hypothetical protein
LPTLTARTTTSGGPERPTPKPPREGRTRRRAEDDDEPPVFVARAGAGAAIAVVIAVAAMPRRSRLHVRTRAMLREGREGTKDKIDMKRKEGKRRRRRDVVVVGGLGDRVGDDGRMPFFFFSTYKPRQVVTRE